MGYYFFAETAFHHEGDIEYLKDLIEGVAETGVDGIKFQVLVNLEDFLVRGHSSFEVVKKWLFNIDQWSDLFAHTVKLGLEIIMMPLDLASFDLLFEFPVSCLELHSVSFHDKVIIDRLQASGLPILLGAGGRTLAEINEKVELFSVPAPVLMTGFQAFPSDLDDVKLSRIGFLANRFPTCGIGYADHTSFENPYALSSLEFAYLLGARYFEKHVTLNEGHKRTDFEAAIGLPKLKEIKERLDYLSTLVKESSEFCMQMSAAEKRYRARQKSVVASQSLVAGQRLSANDLCLKIAETDNGFNDLRQLLGKKLTRSVDVDEVILPDDIS